MTEILKILHLQANLTRLVAGGDVDKIIEQLGVLTKQNPKYESWLVGHARTVWQLQRRKREVV